MNSSEVLLEAFGRIGPLVDKSISGCEPAMLAYRPEPGANSIAWLCWHLARVQDGHVSEIAGLEQAWIADGWASRFGMEPDPDKNGQGDGPDEVAAITTDGDLIMSHYAAIAARTAAYLVTADDAEMDRIIDRSYDPPVTVGVRLVSVISDNIQHAGQARYLRGIVDRLG
jgi:hypothetical protein